MSLGALGAIAAVVAVAVAIGFLATRSRGGSRRRRPPYLVALSALVDGDEETAIREFKNAVRLDSENLDAYLRLGDLFRRRGEAERALHLHRELAHRERIGKEDRARVQGALCRDYIVLGRFEKAAEAAREAARLEEDPSASLSLLLEVEERLGDVDGAFRVKRDLLKRAGRGKANTDELAQYRAVQGETLLENGSLKEAERVLKDARRLDASNDTARRAWGRLRERLGDYSGAVEVWDALLAEDPDDAEGLFHDLERVRFLDGSFGEMEKTYERFLDREPGHEAAAFGLARFLRRKGQLDDALDVCRRGLDANTGSHHLRVLQLALLVQAGRAAEAEAELNEWLAGLGDEPSLVETPS